ncbi:exonuclease domain-containing protein [Sagittula sp. SSi028]|uniref:3'-5' exonuclease n=1 Tax=Sagittula sp. SSi028 TaxID=3400636 RepID=UPI003AF83605
MFDKLSLRLRVFLFFCLMGLGGAALFVGALYAGWLRAMSSGITDGFIFAAVLASLAVVALATGVWLLFDEHLAKPIQRLSTELRIRAHTDAAIDFDFNSTRYLGDLTPAASALSTKATQSAMAIADQIAAETARLDRERAKLTALLSDIPVATLLINASDRIVLYDGQAAEVLGSQAVPKLNAALSDYFDEASLMQARQKLGQSGREVSCTLKGRNAVQFFPARLRPMREGGYMILIDGAEVDLKSDEDRPLTYDFDLLETETTETDEKSLRRLSFTVFDTETTGLLPHKDDVVQIGAVHVVNGRIVPGETIDQLVDPGRPIPVSSTRVHHVTDQMVAGQPDIIEAGRALHRFAKGSVIVAHNAPFDMAFLHRHKGRMDVDWDNPVLDTVLLSAILFGTTEDHTLDALCARLDVSIPSELRHSALGDAMGTAQVFVRMLPMLEARGMIKLGDVIAESKRHGRLLNDLN